MDGDFGEGTENAVKRFQTQYGLTSDGIAGAKTLSTLAGAKATARPTNSPTPKPTAKPAYNAKTYLRKGDSSTGRTMIPALKSKPVPVISRESATVRL